MKPSEIRRLALSARLALAQRNTTPDAFLLAYVAWEALQIRILVVGICASGLSVAEAYQLIKESKVWRSDNRDSLFNEYFGSKPQNAKFVGRLFNKANKSKSIRDRYVHGFKRTSPAIFEKATHELLSILEGDWGTPLKKLLRSIGKDTPFCDPMSTIRGARVLIEPEG